MEENKVVETTETQEAIEGQVVESKTYTEQEFQSEIDRRVTMALKKAEAKNQQKIKEAEKLAQMNEQEKYEYTLQQRELAIAEKERELALSENKNVASQILAEKGLSLSLVDFVVAEDADTMNNNIKILEQAFLKSVNEAVKSRMASKAPRKNLPVDKPIDRKDFLKMSTAELMDLKTNNPDLYEQLRS